MKKVETRTFILELTDGGRRKITVPSTWKLTFGNVLPYNKGGNNVAPYSAPEGWSSRIVLRIYEGNKDNLRAVMHDVLSFRDETVIVEEARLKLVTTAKLKTTNGKQDVEFKELAIGEWYNPDVEFVQKQESEKKNAEPRDKRAGGIAI